MFQVNAAQGQLVPDARPAADDADAPIEWARADPDLLRVILAELRELA